MRTLIVSDLHLGARSGVDVLREVSAREALIAALDGVDRLVVLGDLLELRHGPAREALSAAEPVLGTLAEVLGPEREAVIVPGNHDHGLLRPWLARRSLQANPAPLGLESKVAFRDGDLFARVARSLRPTQVQAAYPGVWIRPDVYATHGHYGDRHNTVPIMERVGAGLMTRLVPEPPGGPASAEDYEATMGPMYAWVEAIAQRDGTRLGVANGSLQVRAWRALSTQPDDVGAARSGEAGRRARGKPAGSGRPRFALAEMRRTGLKLAFPAVVAMLNWAGLGPLGTDVSGPELRRAALRAFGEVVARLQVDAPYVIFGHTHRAGPLARDDTSEWTAPTGSSLLNSGCWVREPRFLGPDPSRSPYRPGFCVVIGDSGPPEVLNLLD